MSQHHQYMQLALELAAQGRCTVSPNPMVGCVLVKDGVVIGSGFHERAGYAHAEIHALTAAGDNAKNATAYVTLEPCCHYGRTPPCTDALIKAGIKKVYIATLDPNPLVAGQGLEALKAAGIEVDIGLCAQEASRLNEIFFHYIKTGQPFVIAKWAMSLDGKTITHPQDSRDISSQDSQKNAHQLREQVDAILIGANTAVNDDPLLTVRHSIHTQPKQPIRIILANRKLPADLKLFAETLPARTIIATTASQEISNDNVEILVLAKDSQGKVDLRHLLRVLGEREISSLLVEGGNEIHQSFFAANLVNKVHVYLAPIIIGNLTKKQPLQAIAFSPLANDFHITANVEVPSV